MTLQRQRLLPRHPDQHLQRRHQRRLARSGGLSAERGGAARRSRPPAIPAFRPAARPRPTRRFPSWRCIAQRAAQRRARREMQRAAESHAHACSTTTVLSGQVTWRDWLRAAQRADRRRRLRRQPLVVPPVDATGLPQSRSQRHRPERVRRRRHRRQRGRRAVRQSRGPRRPRQHRQRLRVGRAADRRRAGTSRCRRGINRTSISNTDRLNPGGGPGSLDGDHAYSRLNPAAGVTFSPTRVVQPLCRLQRRQPCADVDRAGLRRSRRTRASCPTRWRAIRRWIRSSRGPWEAGVRGDARRRRPGTPASFTPATRTTSCSSHRRRPDSATSRTSAARGGRGLSSASNARTGRLTRRRRLHLARRHVRKRGNGRRHRQQHERRGG